MKQIIVTSWKQLDSLILEPIHADSAIEILVPDSVSDTDFDEIHELADQLEYNCSRRIDDGSIIFSGPNSTFMLDEDIAKKLYTHQREGLKWLWDLHCEGKGGILADDLGLGKTLQICGFLAGMFSSGLIKRALVVSTKTIIPRWIEELLAVGLSKKTREYRGTSQSEFKYILKGEGVLLTTYDAVRKNLLSLRLDERSEIKWDYLILDEGEGVLLTTYDAVRKNLLSLRLDERSEIKWDYLILDEGHLIKNPNTQRAQSCFVIHSAHRIVITGTPIQNNLQELWALLNFCNPELLGDKTSFKVEYESPIQFGNDKNASKEEKKFASNVAKKLMDRIKPYVLRRMTSEVFCDDDDTHAPKLSRKNEITVWLKLTRYQQQLYKDFLNNEQARATFGTSPLAALTICGHPRLLKKAPAENLLDEMDPMLTQDEHVVAEQLAMNFTELTKKDNFQGISCKINFILTLVDNLILHGHRVLIFSQTRKMLDLIEESLRTEGHECVRIDSNTNANDRLQIINDFQGGVGALIFLLTSQVGGGLTLTKADRVILVDPAWNPSTDNQNAGRAYRIGQAKDVIVYRLVTCGTVEEKIYMKQVRKEWLLKSATENTDQICYFSKQEFQEIFSPPEEGFNISRTRLELLEVHDTEDEMLTEHINFLESQGIDGVSHHSLLFSKTASKLEEEKAARDKDVKVKREKMDIEAEISRLHKCLADKELMKRLSDKGKKFQNRIKVLQKELDTLQSEVDKN